MEPFGSVYLSGQLPVNKMAGGKESSLHQKQMGLSTWDVYFINSFGK